MEFAKESPIAFAASPALRASRSISGNLCFAHQSLQLLLHKLFPGDRDFGSWQGLYGVLGRFFCMIVSMQIVTVCDKRMMCRLLMVTGGIMFGGFSVMSGRMFVMLRCLNVVFGALFAHKGIFEGLG